jgi:hypothetical protein
MPLNKSIKKLLGIILRVGISIALLVFLFGQVDGKALFRIIRGADIWLLLLAFLIFTLVYAVCLFRWEMLLKAVRVYLPVKRIIVSFSGGMFFNVFMPSTIGGDLVRSFDLAAHTKKGKEVVATVLLDRLSGYAGMVLVAVVAIIFGYRLVQDRAVVLIVLAIVALLALILLLLFNNFFFSKINRFFHAPNGSRLMTAIKNTHQELYYFRQRKRILFLNLAYSIFIQVVAPVSYYLIAVALGIKTDIIYFFIFFPLIGAITLLPISIGGLGLRDATTIYFFAKAGMAKDAAFAISIMVFFYTLLLGALGGIIYVFTLHSRRVQYHKTV